MREYIRGFDVNRRISIPRKIMKELKIDYKVDQVKIIVKKNRIILEKVSD